MNAVELEELKRRAGCASILVFLAVFWFGVIWAIAGPPWAEQTPPVCISGQTLEADGTQTTWPIECSP